MKLTFITPVNYRSAIARSTQLVVNQLEKLGHTVQVINAECQEVPDKERHPFAVNATHWKKTKTVKAILSQTDIPVYQIANNDTLHAGCLALMPLYSGLVVLHDFFIENIVSMAKGVVCHSLLDMKRILTTCAGPVACIPLAYETFNAERYAESLIKVAERVLVCDPISQMTKSMVNDLCRWQLEKDSLILQNIIAPVQSVFNLSFDET